MKLLFSALIALSTVGVYAQTDSPSLTTTIQEETAQVEAQAKLLEAKAKLAEAKAKLEAVMTQQQTVTEAPPVEQLNPAPEAQTFASALGLPGPIRASRNPTAADALENNWQTWCSGVLVGYFNDTYPEATSFYFENSHR